MRGPSDEAWRAGRGRTARALARLHACERGQAIYVVVLFFFLLAGLLFLVLNSGEKLNQKVQMQQAADAVAATGAGWYARGLNAVSLANVAQTQLYSMVILLDTMETVTPPATECIDDLVQKIGSSKAGHDIPIDRRVADPHASANSGTMFLVVGNAASEREIIHQFDDLVKAVDWPEYLTYDNGVLWECAKLMDGFSHAMIQATPRASIREAIDVAKKDHAEFGFTVPFWPELPVQDGQWQDWRYPMHYGRLPPPNDRQVIGGFAWVMWYRGYEPDYLLDPDRRYHGRVLGPYGHWREPFVRTMPMGLFDISRFSVLFTVVSDMKFEMMFGASDDRVSLRSWEMDYDKAKGLPPSRIRRAWWETSSFDCRYPQPTDWPWAPEGGAIRPAFPPPAAGAWRDSGGMVKCHHLNPVPSLRSYRDMSRPSLAGYIRGKEAYEGADPREAVWYRVQPRRTAHYPELDIYAPHPPVHPDGSPWPYTSAEMKTYFHVSLLRFNGAELETDESLHRRYLPPTSGAPMLPVLFDPIEGEHLQANVDKHFTFNGFAYRSGKVANWGQRFVNPNPIEDLVAYAQARVYNRWSWDLFTQHWKVKLMRTDRWKDVLGGLRASVPSADVASQLTDQRIEPVRKMLEAYDDPFVKEVTH